MSPPCVEYEQAVPRRNGGGTPQSELPRREELQRVNDTLQGALQRASRELEEFAWVASHDLREPLRMVHIYTELLTSQYQTGYDEQAQRFAKRIHEGVARMEELIDELLRYSQAAHGECAPVVLRLALDDAIAEFRDKLIAVDAQLEIGRLPEVLGDRDQLALVFRNLISNSLKYAVPERRLEIRIWAQQNRDEWTVRFTDNGAGFAPEFNERVFGLFRRLHASTTPGTGLGLALCRKIVERYGGKIRAEGKPRNGATFIITLKGCSSNEVTFPNTTGRG